jgi:CRISPR-associated protein Csm4
MRLYKSRIKLKSLSASSWQADTVFGHLCWHIFRHEGEAHLGEFLSYYPEGAHSSTGPRPPVLVSDGFPADYLPRPLLPFKESDAGSTKRERILRSFRLKEEAQVRWLRLEEFNKVRSGEFVTSSLTEHEIAKAISTEISQKNQIDRVTNTAGSGSGQLFDVIGYLLPEVSLYWRISDGYLELVREFLEELKNTGYGKRKSVGYGQVESFTLDEFKDFEEIQGANGFVTLSRFVPAINDPTEGYWHTAVKYGKLGEELGGSGNPFKRPLLQIECGACFRDVAPREWYGQLISGLSDFTEVKHYGFAFPLPLKIPEMTFRK